MVVIVAVPVPKETPDCSTYSCWLCCVLREECAAVWAAHSTASAVAGDGRHDQAARAHAHADRHPHSHQACPQVQPILPWWWHDVRATHRNHSVWRRPAGERECRHCYETVSSGFLVANAEKKLWHRTLSTNFSTRLFHTWCLHRCLWPLLFLPLSVISVFAEGLKAIGKQSLLCSFSVCSSFQLVRMKFQSVQMKCPYTASERELCNQICWFFVDCVKDKRL